MRKIKFGIAALVIAALLAGCADAAEQNSKNPELDMLTTSDYSQTTTSSPSSAENNAADMEKGKITELENGLSHTRYSGDYKFDEFLAGGGAESDNEIIAFLSYNLIGYTIPSFGADNFSCSAFSAKGENGYYFGRNFDWYNCNALIVEAYPENGYSSISTVNTDFIGLDANKMGDELLATAAIYAPIDGMNEKGLCVSVNMIEDNESVDQKTDKPDITTTTAVRLLLDKAADVDEALELLGQYDMHASKGLTVHFAVADANGKCVAVEYLNSEMIVTKTPVVTNFYFAEGPKNGKGTQQSHDRYEKLMQTLLDKSSFIADDVMDALESVSKHNYNDGETTEWSAVFNQSTGEVIYCHRENYDKKYTFNINS